MARWIGEVHRIDQEADGSDSETETIVPHRIGVQARNFSKMTLKALFGKQPKRSMPAQLWREFVDEEATLMEALADFEEDSHPDDGAIEIDSDEEYRG